MSPRLKLAIKLIISWICLFLVFLSGFKLMPIIEPRSATYGIIFILTIALCIGMIIIAGKLLVVITDNLNNNSEEIKLTKDKE